MNVHDILFWVFSIAMLVCGVMVIAHRNPVNSAMSLVLLFAFMAGLFVLLEAFFLATIQVLVYAGAVMVLFLFVIMLLDIRASVLKRLRWLGLVGALLVSGLLVWEIQHVLRKPAAAPVAESNGLAFGLSDVVKPLFAQYMLPVQLTALLLLAAMVGVVLLSKRDLQ
ncbi:MAG: NADH-quinone oxidoreductase subunit J [Verrucomicrobiae bacterium]|nr:NADH-quinone oxidoreductase subunit J [Verrucomicrobiae bacterium]MDW8344067.1 NADH-quinone oxidoreductase subunit J [Verrucomicrobiae bacterium]